MDKETILQRLREQAAEIRSRFSVETLSIFGSVAGGHATSKSDVDVLVSFGRKPDFDLFMELKFYLEELLETKVDLVTDKALRPQVKQAISQEIIRVA